MAASAFSPSALWSQLGPMWKPYPSQETSTSNKFCDKSSFNLNKQKLFPSSLCGLPSGIDDKEDATKSFWEREAGLAHRPGFWLSGPF